MNTDASEVLPLLGSAHITQAGDPFACVGQRFVLASILELGATCRDATGQTLPRLEGAALRLGAAYLREVGEETATSSPATLDVAGATEVLKAYVDERRRSAAHEIQRGEKLICQTYHAEAAALDYAADWLGTEAATALLSAVHAVFTPMIKERRAA